MATSMLVRRKIQPKIHEDKYIAAKLQSLFVVAIVVVVVVDDVNIRVVAVLFLLVYVFLTLLKHITQITPFIPLLHFYVKFTLQTINLSLYYNENLFSNA
jgi:hypothetical protein